MTNALQHRLSARPVRTNVAALETAQSAGGAILYEFLRSEDDGRAIVQETHYISNPTVKAGLSGPPLHIHLNQDETFKVLSGKLGVSIRGVAHVLSAESPETTIPAGTRHTFFPHPSSTENIKFQCWVEPQDVKYGLDEGFLRNFAGYLRDCEEQKVGPSIFQLLLFLYDADIILAPPFWAPIWLLKAMHHLCGYWIGSGLLGYRASYPEYTKMTRSGTVSANKAI